MAPTPNLRAPSESWHLTRLLGECLPGPRHSQLQGALGEQQDLRVPELPLRDAPEGYLRSVFAPHGRARCGHLPHFTHKALEPEPRVSQTTPQAGPSPPAPGMDGPPASLLRARAARTSLLVESFPPRCAPGAHHVVPQEKDAPELNYKPGP